MPNALRDVVDHRTSVVRSNSTVEKRRSLVELGPCIDGDDDSGSDDSRLDDDEAMIADVRTSGFTGIVEIAKDNRVIHL